MKSKFNKFLIVAILSMLVLTACGAVSQVTAVSNAGKAFMTALKDGNHQASWDMLTQTVKDEVGNYDGWVAFATPRNFSTFSFSSNNITNNEAQLDGEASLNGETYTVTLVFDKTGDQWLVSGINFALKK
jgi:hypothetical protein